MNSQEEETLLKVHGLGELCSDHHGHLLPATGKHWATAYFHRKQHDEAAKTPCKSAQTQKGKLCTTEVTKTLVIINKDQETTSTAQPALTARQGNSDNCGNETELHVPCFSLHGDATHQASPKQALRSSRDSMDVQMLRMAPNSARSF